MNHFSERPRSVLLRDYSKHAEYGLVVLPLLVLRRRERVLASTHAVRPDERCSVGDAILESTESMTHSIWST